jgi:phage terminase small subunit
MADTLTPKQESFCQHMLSAPTAAEAYRRAYQPRSASEKTCWEAASRMVRHTKISARLAVLRAQAADLVTVTPSQVVAELAALAFGTLDDVAPWDATGPHLIASADLPLTKRKLVASIKVKRRREWIGRGDNAEAWEVEDIEVKPWDKLRALELLGKTLAMFTDKIRIEASDADLLRACEAAGLDPSVVLREVDAILAEAK